MIGALARKEFRELLPLVALALVVQVVVVAPAMNISLGLLTPAPAPIPFLTGQDLAYPFFVGAIFAVAAALRQTMWEAARGTFPLLLHRPTARDTIFGVKLAVGAAACLVVLGGPLAVYTLWVATPGTHAAPFFWSMAAWAWLLCLQMPVVYLAAFLCGLRPARWYASRFLPLAGVGLVLVIGDEIVESPWGKSLWLAATLAVAAALVMAICYIGRTRDYS